MPSCRVDIEICPFKETSRLITFYYPSTCVKNYLKPGTYPLYEFCQIAIAALHEAKRRVMEKWGISCSGCMILEHNLQKMIEKYEFTQGEARVLQIE